MANPTAAPEDTAPHNGAPGRPKQQVRIVHATRGWIRIRVPSVKGSPRLAEHVESRLTVAPGVRRASASAETGSVIIQYDPDHYRSPAQLVSLGRALHEVLGDIELEGLDQFLGGGSNPEKAEKLAASVQEFLGSLNGSVEQALGVDLRLLVPAGLLALGVGNFVLSDRAVPNWYDLLWFSFSSFLMLNRQSAPSADELAKSVGK